MGDAGPARAGREGSTQRLTFVPTRIRLSTQRQGESATSVLAVDTAPNGDLGLPSDPGVVGWWQSGALAGEAFGSVVLAGHIDSRTQGLGFFVRLLQAEPGDSVDLSDSQLKQVYRVVSNRTVDKTILATGTESFSQRVPGQLVLITCTGNYDQVAHRYEDNLVVTADPVGVATGND